jgi:hypothetical protein
MTRERADSDHLHIIVNIPGIISKWTASNFLSGNSSNSYNGPLDVVVSPILRDNRLPTISDFTDACANWSSTSVARQKSVHASRPPLCVDIICNFMFTKITIISNSVWITSFRPG